MRLGTHREMGADVVGHGVRAAAQTQRFQRRSSRYGPRRSSSLSSPPPPTAIRPREAYAPVSSSESKNGMWKQRSSRGHGTADGSSVGGSSGGRRRGTGAAACRDCQRGSLVVLDLYQPCDQAYAVQTKRRVHRRRQIFWKHPQTRIYLFKRAPNFDRH